MGLFQLTSSHLPDVPEPRAELQQLVTTKVINDIAALVAEATINRDYQLPYVAGVSNDNKIIYVGCDVPEMLSDGANDFHSDAGVAWHELGEKYFMDQFGLVYDDAHALVTWMIEQPMVTQIMRLNFGGYQRAFDPYVIADEHERLTHVPPDLFMGPYEDDASPELLAAIRQAQKSLQKYNDNHDERGRFSQSNATAVAVERNRTRVARERAISEMHSQFYNVSQHRDVAQHLEYINSHLRAEQASVVARTSTWIAQESPRFLAAQVVDHTIGIVGHHLNREVLGTVLGSVSATLLPLALSGELKVAAGAFVGYAVMKTAESLGLMRYMPKNLAEKVSHKALSYLFGEAYAERRKGVGLANDIIDEAHDRIKLAKVADEILDALGRVKEMIDAYPPPDAATGESWGKSVSQIRAAGVVYVDPDGNVLFLRRGSDSDHAGAWNLPGGTIEGEETPAEAAAREFEEETGQEIDAEELSAATRRDDGRVDYVTFSARGERFEPELDGENDAVLWSPISDPPRPLHPGLDAVMSQLSAHVDGTLVVKGDTVNTATNLVWHDQSSASCGGDINWNHEEDDVPNEVRAARNEWKKNKDGSWVRKYSEDQPRDRGRFAGSHDNEIAHHEQKAREHDAKAKNEKDSRKAVLYALSADAHRAAAESYRSGDKRGGDLHAAVAHHMIHDSKHGVNAKFAKYSPDQERDARGRFGSATASGYAQAQANISHVLADKNKEAGDYHAEQAKYMRDHQHDEDEANIHQQAADFHNGAADSYQRAAALYEGSHDGGLAGDLSFDEAATMEEGGENTSFSGVFSSEPAGYWQHPVRLMAKWSEASRDAAADARRAAAEGRRHQVIAMAHERAAIKSDDKSMSDDHNRAAALHRNAADEYRTATDHFGSGRVQFAHDSAVRAQDVGRRAEAFESDRKLPRVHIMQNNASKLATKGATNMDEINFFMPITKKEPQADGSVIVTGYASTPTRDLDGEIIALDAVKKALPSYMEWRNIRAMHQPNAVGKAKEAHVDDVGLYLRARIVEPGAVHLVNEEVYQGFSIGGRKLAKQGDTVTDLELVEISIVDRPCNPDTRFAIAKRATSLGKGAAAAQPISVINSKRIDLVRAVDPKPEPIQLEREELSLLGRLIQKLSGGSKTDVAKRDVSDKERSDLADEGKAMPDGSFPIASEDDLKNAIQAHGRAKNPATAKRHIVRRAKAMGSTHLLPEGWSGSSKSEKAAGLEKAADMYTISQMIELLGRLEFLEEACEGEAGFGIVAIPGGGNGTVVEVDKAFTDKFGAMLVQFADLTAELLDKAIGQMKEEEAEEAAEKIASFFKSDQPRDDHGRWSGSGSGDESHAAAYKQGMRDSRDSGSNKNPFHPTDEKDQHDMYNAGHARGTSIQQHNKSADVFADLEAIAKTAEAGPRTRTDGSVGSAFADLKRDFRLN